LTRVDVLVRFLSIRRSGNGTGVADGGFAQARADGDPHGLALRRPSGVAGRVWRGRAWLWQCRTFRSSDPTAPPRIRVNDLQTELDPRTMIAGIGIACIGIACEVIVQKGFDPYRGRELVHGPAVETDAELVEWLRAKAMTTFHPVRTCKRGAPRCDVRRPRLTRVHRRYLDARGHSRPGRDTHKSGALFTGRRHDAGLTSAPLRVVFRHAPIGARHNAGRVP
jgi:choline dehydrogenase-like flavoprotein